MKPGGDGSDWLDSNRRILGLVTERNNGSGERFWNRNGGHDRRDGPLKMDGMKRGGGGSRERGVRA